MKTRAPRRYFHRHYVNVATPRDEREARDPAWSAATWIGFAAVATGVVCSVAYMLG